MKTIATYLLAYLLRLALWFRYRLTVKGLKKLTPELLNKPGGVLFLPNHPSVFVDPIAVTLAAWPKFSIRPLIVEYMYYATGIHWIMKLLDALPIPNFAYSSNSLKRKKSEETITAIINSLAEGENFLLYPAGRVKLSAYEAIGGASAAHQIIQQCPTANVVLVRIKGLWGSSFSTYLTGKTPSMMETVLQGVKFCLKNLLFFTPRRNLIIEFEAAGNDFPFQGSRIEFNRYLEQWYNKPDGLTPQSGKLPGDSLVLISYSMWGEKYLPMQKGPFDDEGHLPLETIPLEIKEKVIGKLAEITEKDRNNITTEMDLAMDLAMDSLDMAELATFLQDNFEIKTIPVNNLTSVGKVIAIAAKEVAFEEEPEEEADISKWKGAITRERLQLPAGETIAELFLNGCTMRGSSLACGDLRSGLLTFKQLKMRTLLLAEYIRTLPGEKIGILLPASVAANIAIMATILAGKIPLMVNWTVGPRHLEAIVALSNVELVLSSWAFIDKLENIDFNGIEDKIVFLEEVRRKISVKDKALALYRSKLSTKKLLKLFSGGRATSPNDTAALLFTSGTESMPKGVPLTHANILSNLRSILEVIDVYSDDVLLGILPPFHAFGFTVSTLFGLLMGIRLASFPDPTNGIKLAEGVERWGATLLCGAPTFLKGMLKAATKEQLDTLRLCVTGAEKAPPELFALMADHGKKDILLEGYGITECSPVITVNRVGEPPRGVGKPIRDIELCIVHPESFEEMPEGEQGLILVCGPNVFPGYLNPEVASPFIEKNGKTWYKTGDLGVIDKEGYLSIAGRLKRFIKIGGEMVGLAAIEEAIGHAFEGKNGVDGGPSIAITAQERDGEKPKIFLFTLYDTDLDSINHHLRKEGFSNLVKISKVIKVKEIPLLGTGKVNYRALSDSLNQAT